MCVHTQAFQYEICTRKVQILIKKMKVGNLIIVKN